MNAQSDSPVAALSAVAQALDAMDVPWFITGSIASSLHGVPRSTNDLDIVVLLRPDQAHELVQRLGDGYFADERMISESFGRRQACNLIWLETMMKIDLMPPRFEFDGDAMRRRQRLALSGGVGTALPVWVATPEDAILAKLFWYRAGGSTSERQLSDIRGIIAAQSDRLDREYLWAWARRCGMESALGIVLPAQP